MEIIFTSGLKSDFSARKSMKNYCLLDLASSAFFVGPSTFGAS